MGICYQKTNQVSKAIQQYQKSIIGVESAEGLNALGQAYFSQYEDKKDKKDLVAAEKYYKKAMEVDENYVVTFFNMGALLLLK